MYLLRITHFSMWAAHSGAQWSSERRGGDPGCRKRSTTASDLCRTYSTFTLHQPGRLPDRKRNTRSVESPWVRREFGEFTVNGFRNFFFRFFTCLTFSARIRCASQARSKRLHKRLPGSLKLVSPTCPPVKSQHCVESSMKPRAKSFCALSSTPGGIGSALQRC